MFGLGHGMAIPQTCHGPGQMLTSGIGEFYSGRFMPAIPTVYLMDDGASGLFLGKGGFGTVCARRRHKDAV